MAKKILGIDVGGDSLKLALVSGGRVQKTALVAMPKHMIKEGQIVSLESMGDLIRTAMKENNIRARDAAYIMPNETVFVKNVTMPRMSAEQLVFNLPFEFRDYITDDVSGYVFDYATITEETAYEPQPKRKKVKAAPTTEVSAYSQPQDAFGASPEPMQPLEAPEAEGDTMELLAVGTPRATIEDLRVMLHKAGLRLSKAAPALCSHVGLLRSNRNLFSEYQEFCILDLGYRAIRMYMYKNDRHIVTRELEYGLSYLDDVLADKYNVDVHLAHTYLITDYEGCQRQDACMNAYSTIAVELMRAMNFYRFSNPDSRLSDVWLCGGGVEIEALRESIAQALGMNIHPASELVSGGEIIPHCDSFVQAIGITLD